MYAELVDGVPQHCRLGANLVRSGREGLGLCEGYHVVGDSGNAVARRLCPVGANTELGEFRAYILALRDVDGVDVQGVFVYAGSKLCGQTQERGLGLVSQSA
jgi:hypothetical protein